MGISDKDYGDALLQKHYKVHQEQLELFSKKQTVEEMIKVARDAVDNKGTITYTTQNRTPLKMTTAGVRPLTEQDIQSEAMQAPLSSLVDMWIVRWSGTWVSESDFQEDNFWRVALIRLLGANKVEKHHLANRIGAVYRIIE